MADNTKLFKATVKALNSRTKITSGDDASKLILSKKPKRSDFDSKAKNLVQTITQLKEFLLKNRKEYVSSGSLLSSAGIQMTESERDQIDAHAQSIIKSCRETIAMFKGETGQRKVHPQVKEHHDSVMVLIESYLKAVCKIYSEQKAVRVKRVVDRKKISRLEPERKHNHMTRHNLKKELNIGQNGMLAKDNSSNTDKISPAKKAQTFSPDMDNKPETYGDDELTPEEAQMFALENQSMYDEMNSMSEEVRQIEGQVVEIAKLQEIFTEKILEQDVQINSIANTVVGTSQNIDDANKEIREAIKKKAEYRVWILFFLIVCSLSLLFLDWYNA